MDLLGLKEVIQREDHTIDLKIENFSSGDNAPLEKTFSPKLFTGLYGFSVSVHPNGIAPKYRDYVSLEVKSFMVDKPDLSIMGYSNSMSGTASVVDVAGIERYSQSFGIANLLFPKHCVPDLERFISRSALLSQQEDLLPDDVLTVRIEFSFISDQEIGVMSKIAEFIPTLLASASALCAGVADNRDFYGIFKDIEEKSEGECKEASDNLCDNQLCQSIKAQIAMSGDGIFKEIGATSPFDFGIYKKSEGSQLLKDVARIEQKKANPATSTELCDENESAQKSVGGMFSEAEANQSSSELFDENKAAQTSRGGLYNENEEGHVSDIESKNQTYDYRMIEENKESFELFNDGPFHQQMSTQSNDDEGEKTTEGVDKILKTFEIGHEPTKNALIVTNAHRLFVSWSKSPKNSFDFALMTDDELYKLFYSIQHLQDEESKSIYRMQGGTPFSKNLMDRDESAPVCVDFHETAEVQETTIVASTSEESNETSQNKAKDLDDTTESLKYSHSGSECMSSGKFRSDTAEESGNVSERNGTSNATAICAAELVEDVENSYESSHGKEDSDNGKWEFLIQTSDDVTIRVPFEENEQTIGCKLLAASPVFKNMLKLPMKEKSQRRVEMKDASAKTVNNLLSYVDSGKFSDIPLPDAYELYELADEYDVKNLMRACADFMAYFPIRENVWSMVKLAQLHCDDYLLELAESVRKLVFRLEQTAVQKKNIYTGVIMDLLTFNTGNSVTERKTQSDFYEQDFNFYQ